MKWYFFSVHLFFGALILGAEVSGQRHEVNVLDEALQDCAEGVGFYRDGKCSTGPTDYGTHTVCSRVTQNFLDFTVSKGNDLVTPGYGFKGLHAGDRWCLCALRWRQALEAGHAPPVILKATNNATLFYVSQADLAKHVFE